MKAHKKDLYSGSKIYKNKSLTLKRQGKISIIPEIVYRENYLTSLNDKKISISKLLN